MKRKGSMLCAALLMGALILFGCGKQPEEPVVVGTAGGNASTVTLKYWEASEEDSPQIAMMEKVIENFKAEHSEVNFDITIEAVGSDCKDRMISDLDNAPDVFTFADDQLLTLVAAGLVGPIENAEEISSKNLPAAVEAATVNDKLYAYPLTADNGYFLFYDKSVLDESDIASMDALCAKAQAAGKRVTFDVDNGWYFYSFFGNSGLTVGLNDDGITNYCTWNSTEGDVKGVDVCKGIEDLVAKEAFYNAGDDELKEWAKEGTLAAAVSGVWVSADLEEACGDNLGAAKLPTYTAAGKQIQMSSYAGYRLVGVSHLSKNEEWAVKLAEYITDEANQTLRFTECGQGPSNIKAADSEAVRKSVALNALIEQSDYSSLQRIGNTYWGPAADLGAALSEGAGDLQKRLDDAVKEITALPSD